MANRAAYFGGFFDGEGCVELLKLKNTNKYRVVVSLTQKNVGFIQDIANELGAYVYHNKSNGSSYCRLYGKHAIAFLKRIVNYTQIKYWQIIGVLEFYKTYQINKAAKTHQPEYYEWCRTQIKKLKYIEDYRSVA